MAGAESSEDVALGATQRTEHQGPSPGSRLPRGTQVDRYLVLGEIGAGGMGVVYSAYDPELDRKVAIKLVQASSGGSVAEERTWVLREAQALARLSHPNVVAVHDVGTFETDRVFVAMELVAGMTLRVWLERAHRSWREVVPVMLAAGAGLAAAHAAGLVHRDFKPDNVIVGDDGRVRVMDFGLARLRREGFDEQAARASDAKIDTHSPLSQQLTVQGAIVGTPAYLAPEIYAGKPADARSDQYAFGVAMYFALWRKIPYDLQQIVEGTAKPPKPPAEPAVPARIQRVVLRALAISPEDRYESVDALSRDLAAAVAPRKRAAIAIAGAVAVIGAGSLFVATRGTNEPCSGSEQRLAGVWDAQARQKLHAAYLATKLPYAEHAVTVLDEALGHYAHDWVTMATDSCKATRVRRDQTEAVMSLRQACLDQHLAGMRALVRELSDQPSDALVAKADGPAFELRPLAACADTDSLGRADPAPADPRIAIAQQAIDEASAQLVAGRYMAVLVSSKRALDLADQIGWRPLQANAHRFRGAALLSVANLDEGMQEYIIGTHQAIAAKDDALAAEMALLTASFTATSLRRASEAKIWLEVGLAEAERATPSDGLELTKQSATAMVSSENGDHIRAVAAARKMVDVASRMYGNSAHPVMSSELQLATVLDRASQYGEALTHYRTTLALAEGAIGPDHPENAFILASIGVCLGKLGRLDEAREQFQRGLSLLEKSFGPNSPLLVVTLNNMADSLNLNGDPEGALPYIDRALALSRAASGDDAPTLTAGTTRGEILTRAKRFPEARAQLDELIAVETRVQPTMLPITLASRAELALAEHAWADGAQFAQRSIDGFETAGGKNNPDLWRPLAALGRAQIELGKRDDARATLERALALTSKLQLGDQILSPLRATYADATSPR